MSVEVACRTFAGRDGKGLAPGLKGGYSCIRGIRETCRVPIALDLAFEPDVVARATGKNWKAFIPLILVL